MFDLVYPSEPAPLYPRPSIDRPGPQAIPSDEILPLAEPSGLVYGRASRAWCHSGTTALHPVVHLHLMDREGRLCLQKRSLRKHRWPGYWDTAVGGHVSYGEQILEALFRETAEELGLTAFNPIFIASHVFKSSRDWELVVSFAAIGHPELHPAKAEVTECRWFTPEELSAASSRGILTPNFEWEWARIENQVRALL